MRQDLSFYKSPIAEELREEGREEGREESRVSTLAEAVVLVLEKRRLQTGYDVRERVAACDDPDMLRSWLMRAAVVPVAEGIFEEDAG